MTLVQQLPLQLINLFLLPLPVPCVRLLFLFSLLHTAGQWAASDEQYEAMSGKDNTQAFLQTCQNVSVANFTACTAHLSPAHRLCLQCTWTCSAEATVNRQKLRSCRMQTEQNEEVTTQEVHCSNSGWLTKQKQAFFSNTNHPLQYTKTPIIPVPHLNMHAHQKAQQTQYAPPYFHLTGFTKIELQILKKVSRLQNRPSQSHTEMCTHRLTDTQTHTLCGDLLVEFRVIT